jgi:hypothetical protein
MVCYKGLRERTAVSGGPPAHGLDDVHGCAGRTERHNKGVG